MGHSSGKCYRNENSCIHNARPNPLRIDPTRTSTLRGLFSQELARRFRMVGKELRESVLSGEVLGPSANARYALVNREMVLTRNARYVFKTHPDMLEAFEKGVKRSIRRHIIDPDGDRREPWFKRYIMDGYRKGAGKALRDFEKSVKKPASYSYYPGGREAFLEDSFGRPETKEKLDVLTARVFTELSGITESMASQLTRVLADGLMQGKWPIEIARDISKTIGGITSKRAKVLARTEIIRAHAEAQLDTLERYGVTEVGVKAEWSTAVGACPLCVPLEGVVLTTDKARGLIPRHPNCRCSWLPIIPEDVTKANKLGGAAKRALSRSVGEERPSESREEALRKSRWIGADRV